MSGFRRQIWFGLLVLWLAAVSASGQDRLCAEVQMQINQQATIERQAFDSRMRINNGLAGLSLEEDETQNARFFR